MNVWNGAKFLIGGLLVVGIFSLVISTLMNSAESGSLTPSPVSDIRLPISDVSNTGSWSVYPISPTTQWDKADDPIADDNITYMTISDNGTTWFSITPFSMPDDTTNLTVTVHVRCKVEGSGTFNVLPSLIMGGNYSLDLGYQAVTSASGWIELEIDIPHDRFTGADIDWAYSLVNNHITGVGVRVIKI